MMISEGRGIQADSMAIMRAMPKSPRDEIAATMKDASRAISWLSKPVTPKAPADILHIQPRARAQAWSRGFSEPTSPPLKARSPVLWPQALSARSEMMESRGAYFMIVLLG
jgi:hypothetical protein